MDLYERSTAIRPVAWDGGDLYPYQTAAVEQVRAGWRHHAIFAHHPGAGKTPMALVASGEYERVLIVCPPSITRQWAARVAEWRSDDVFVAYRGDMLAETPKHDCVIVPDSMLHFCPPLDGRFVIVDEVHRFKERSARRTRALFGGKHEDKEYHGFTREAQHIVALTGTPVVASPVDMFPVLRAMGFEDTRTFKGFCDLYCPEYQAEIRTAKGVFHEPRYDRPINLPVLARKLRETFLIRPKREDYLDQLPPVRTEVFSVHVDDDEFQEDTPGEDEVLDDANSPCIAELRQHVGRAKAVQFKSAMCDMIAGGERPVVWCWHRGVADQLARECGLLAVHGQHSLGERAKRVAAFAAGETPGLAMTISASGTGLDGLQHITDLCIFVEESFVPAENEQAMARIHRSGQKNPVRVMYVRSNSVIDRAVARANARKTANAEGTLQ